MAGRLYVGTSGFAYAAWKNGVFYPPGVRNDRMLEHYASVLSSVEINYTFRRRPDEKTLLAWRAQTPEDFRFALKANMRITHIKQLRNTGPDIVEFSRRVAALGDRLGPVLFRCPPTLERDDALITAFADDVPPGMLAAVQFDHPSWTGTEGLLAERGIALCIADTDEDPHDEGAPLATHPFAYIRLRRSDYTADDLRRWADRVRAVLAAGRDVHCYFKHEDSGTGPRWASAMLALLSAP